MKKKLMILALMLQLFWLGLMAQSNNQVVYLPIFETLPLRETPQWYNNAKLGIFINWGLYSVPAWATPTTTPYKVTDWKAFCKSNPNAEWYLNSLRINGSPTQSHHEKIYGKQFEYYSFRDSFINQASNWNAEVFRWSRLEFQSKSHNQFMARSF